LSLISSRPCPGKGSRFRSCPNLIRGNVRLCPECEALNNNETKEYDRRRGSSSKRGYDAAWKKLRELKANHNPLCEVCLNKGIERPLDLVHHVMPVEDYPKLRLVMENLLSVCIPCHEHIHNTDRWGRKPHSGVGK
jgi:5-methylcytosine-specific restriction endonuclease McrA